MKIIHFADLHLGVETYGRPDPETGLSSRLLDFLAAFDQLVDYALDNRVDLVLFCGDAYKSREPTPTQQREFARRVNRLAAGGIPVFLLTGNHDLPNASARATATEIFDTLAVQKVYVASRPDIHIIPTASGTVQVVSLPWLRRSSLLTRDEMKGQTLAQINERMQEVLADIISSLAAKLDPTLPAILAAHVWVTGAATSSEKSMVLGQEHELMLGNIALPAFDYIALGHIHKHQVLKERPPMVYSGSLARLNFGEEGDEKGFYVVDIEPEGKATRRVSYQFHPIAGRRFLTFNITLEPGDSNPTATVMKLLCEQEEGIRDSIVRLNVSLPVEMESQLRDADLRAALKEAHFASITHDTKREIRLRLGQLTAEELTPLDALQAYLESQKTGAERTKTLLEYGKRLISEPGA